MKAWKITAAAVCVLASAQVWGEVHISPDVPYENKDNIAERIINECTAIGKVMSENAVKAGEGKGVKFVASEDFAKQDEYVKVEIVSATSAGSAMIGHWKGIAVSAEFYRKGKLVDKTKLERHSTGGMFGGFKGSCAVLNRTATTLGKDIAAWTARVSGQPAQE